MNEPFEWPLSTPDALAFTLGSQTGSATHCDVGKFLHPEEAVNSLTRFSLDQHSEEFVENFNSGIIYLKSTVAASLICLSRKFPLNRCTYIGEDNGSKTLQVTNCALEMVQH